MLSVRRGMVSVLLFLATAWVGWAQQREFAIGPVKAAAGTRASGWLSVPAAGEQPRRFSRPGADVSPGWAGLEEEASRIPVTVVHGAKPGPVLALIAGTHGYEYAPIVAMQRLAQKVEPRELAGTVIVVHVANMPSFLARTVYYSPLDGQNLNRVYPGKENGTLSERIAWTITHEVIERADYVVDLHCGDGNEALRPYTYWMVPGGKQTPVAEKSRQMALAFGLDHIVIDTERSPDPNRSVYTSNTAITRGKPSITTETGGLGRIDDDGPELAEAGAVNLLRHFGMLAGGSRSDVRRAAEPVWIDRSVVLRSKATGTFHARVKPGQRVGQGALIGLLTDFFGNTVEEVRAPFEGVVLYVVATPPVRQSEPLGMIGHIQGEK